MSETVNADAEHTESAEASESTMGLKQIVSLLLVVVVFIIRVATLFFVTPIDFLGRM